MPSPGSIPPSSIPRPPPLSTIGVNSGETTAIQPPDELITEPELIERKITTEGKRSRPPIPEGFERIDSNEE